MTILISEKRSLWNFVSANRCGSFPGKPEAGFISGTRNEFFRIQNDMPTTTPGLNLNYCIVTL
jgi:hypothetical protein